MVSEGGASDLFAKLRLARRAFVEGGLAVPGTYETVTMLAKYVDNLRSKDSTLGERCTKQMKTLDERMAAECWLYCTVELGITV